MLNATNLVAGVGDIDDGELFVVVLGEGWSNGSVEDAIVVEDELDV